MLIAQSQRLLVASGGKRAGAGRPKKVDTELKEALQMAEELRQFMRDGLHTAASAFPELIEEEVANARDAVRVYVDKEGDTYELPDHVQRSLSRRFIISKLLDTVALKEPQRKTVAEELLEAYKDQDKEQHELGAKSPTSSGGVGPQTFPRTSGTPLPRESD